MIKETTNGQKGTFVLGDGTRIRLNSASVIQFPEKFIGDTRQVKLRGEAWFEVSENPEKPFQILTGGISTTVLGTTFNWNLINKPFGIRKKTASKSG